jgi:hypothetical protein
MTSSIISPLRTPSQKTIALSPLLDFSFRLFFSLWRAVFICPPAYHRDETLPAAEKFLTNLIEDNTITYFREKEHQNWTFSYFLNNAALRLQELSDERFNLVDPDLFSPVNKVREVWHKRRDAWCLCHKAAKDAVDKLEAELTAPRRSAR